MGSFGPIRCHNDEDGCQKKFSVFVFLIQAMDSLNTTMESSNTILSNTIINPEQISQKLDHWPWMKTEIWYSRFEKFMMDYNCHPRVLYDRQRLLAIPAFFKNKKN